MSRRPSTHTTPRPIASKAARIVPHVTTDNDAIDKRQGCGDMAIPPRAVLRTVELTQKVNDR